MANVLEVLIHASEKAAVIARSCTQTGPSALLVCEKSVEEANKRFDKDYKTIVDVLAQETAKALITTHFPQLVNNVRGEECNNIRGVKIILPNNAEKINELLSTILPSDIAAILTEAVHEDVTDNLPQLPTNLPVIDPAKVGIWIDPIDATAEFIAGIQRTANSRGGLPCVTVLIGAYLRSSGKPILGVINRPFYRSNESHIIWGLNYADKCKSSHKNENRKEKIVLVSHSERMEVIAKFRNFNWKVMSPPGAGNKLMKVATGEVLAYINSQETTYKWDTCAAHAILLAKGGNIVNCRDFKPITYNDEKDLETNEYRNKHGILAYVNNSVLEEIKTCLNSD